MVMAFPLGTISLVTGLIFHHRNKRGFNPCTFLGDPKTDRTPSTISKPPGTADTKRRMKNSTKRHKPTVHEMDELFSGSEQEQQQQFIKKYDIQCL